MKRILKSVVSVLLLLCLAFSIVGCGEETSDEKPVDGSGSVIDEGIIENLTLTIEMEKTTYTKGEEIIVNYSFTNGTGEDLKITYDFLIYPEIATAHLPAVEFPPLEKGVLKNGEIKADSENLSDYLPLGIHVIQYKASFYLGWDCVENGQRIVVYSNTVEISVVE
ncbi:MAG: hypothetical protein IJF44_00310 [Clostridia bacterium]|nr:hypothetical protein [Clostridia bacterium]